MEIGNLRKCPGGYKRDDVIAYIEGLVQKYEEAIKSAQTENENARREMEAMTKENAELYKRIRVMEEERETVSRAVISAQKEADDIRAAARLEGEAIIAEKQEEAAKAEEEMHRLRRDIRTMRLSAAAAIRKYETALAALSADAEDDEE